MYFQKRNRAASINFHIHVSMSDLYIPRTGLIAITIFLFCVRVNEIPNETFILDSHRPFICSVAVFSWWGSGAAPVTTKWPGGRVSFKPPSTCGRTVCAGVSFPEEITGC